MTWCCNFNEYVSFMDKWTYFWCCELYFICCSYPSWELLNQNDEIRKLLNYPGTIYEPIFKVSGHFSINTGLLTKESLAFNHWHSYLKKGVFKIWYLKNTTNQTIWHLQQRWQTGTDQTWIKHLFSPCICRYLLYFLDNINRLNLKNYRYHTFGSGFIKVVESTLQ